MDATHQGTTLQEAHLETHIPPAHHRVIPTQRRLVVIHIQRRLVVIPTQHLLVVEDQALPMEDYHRQVHSQD